MRKLLIGTFAVLAVGAAGAAAYAMQPAPKLAPDVQAALRALPLETYGTQRVLYHVTDGETLLQRRFGNILRVAGNHTQSVKPGELDLRFVLQGGGVDLLIKAKQDAAVAAEVDRLKIAGVRFLICRNTLTQRAIDPWTQLHGVTDADIIRAGVGEAAKLAAAGYVYMKM
jgi:uncharacterized protein